MMKCQSLPARKLIPTQGGGEREESSRLSPSFLEGGSTSRSEGGAAVVSNLGDTRN